MKLSWALLGLCLVLFSTTEAAPAPTIVEGIILKKLLGKGIIVGAAAINAVQNGGNRPTSGRPTSYLPNRPSYSVRPLAPGPWVSRPLPAGPWVERPADPWVSSSAPSEW